MQSVTRSYICRIGKIRYLWVYFTVVPLPPGFISSNLLEFPVESFVWQPGPPGLASSTPALGEIFDPNRRVPGKIFATRKSF